MKSCVQSLGDLATQLRARNFGQLFLKVLPHLKHEVYSSGKVNCLFCHNGILTQQINEAVLEIATIPLYLEHK
jgi:hypothetical protein